MLGTRPDIATTVSLLSRYQQAPYDMHWRAIKRVLRYLNGTRDIGIIYNFQDVQFLKLEAFCDASHASDLDDGKSNSGFVFLLGGSPISWSSKKQTIPASSTTESEYMALHLASAEALWIRNMLRELGYEQNNPIKFFCDNRGAISLSKNPALHTRAKHIDLKYHVVRSRLERKKIEVEFVSTSEQLADIFTKAIPAPQFKNLRNRLNIRNI
jgi:hypothetical protein